MVMFHISYALELIALGLGVGLLIWAMREKGHGAALGKAFGYIITIFSVILLICTLWSNAIVWRMHQQMLRTMQMQQIHPMMIQQIMQQRAPATKPAAPLHNKPMQLQKPQSHSAPAAKAKIAKANEAKATPAKTAAAKTDTSKSAAQKAANTKKPTATNNSAAVSPVLPNKEEISATQAEFFYNG